MVAKKKEVHEVHEEHEHMEACDCEGGCCGDYGYCGCVHHYTLPVLGTVFGALFLLNALGMWVTDYALSIAWPIIVILASLYFLTKRFCNCCYGCC